MSNEPKVPSVPAVQARRATSLEATPPRPQSWQVVEIEGEATPVYRETVAEQQLIPAPSNGARSMLGHDGADDLLDDVIVAGLDTHHLTIAPGETALFGVNLLNNGDRRAHFTLLVEGAIDPQWLVVTAGERPAQDLSAVVVTLAVGERATCWLALTPPPSSQSSAGDHPFSLSVRSGDYPGRVSRLNARLTILPYVDFAIGATKPAKLTTTWRQRTVRIRIPLHNRSNQPTAFLLHSRATNPAYRSTFPAATSSKSAENQSQVTASAGQRLMLTAQVTLPAAPWLRLEKQQEVIRFAVAPITQLAAVQTTQVQIHSRAFFGPWHLAGLFLLAGGGVVSALVLAVAMLVLALRPAPVAAPPPVVNPAPIAIVVNLAQPAQAAPPASQPSAPLPATPMPNAALPNIVNLAPDQPNPDPALPIVSAAQISAPGAAAPAAFVPQSAPPQSARPAEQTPKTYQQMFQEIALGHDLNWRVLAAQAYVESGFDAVALGNSGDMGLMQILPGTWREWAPVAKVTDPFDSYSNALVAAVYLDYLRGQLGKKGYPQIEWMLVAYNWGIDKVLDHLSAGQGWDDLPAERRQYALDILRIAETIPLQ